MVLHPDSNFQQIFLGMLQGPRPQTGGVLNIGDGRDNNWRCDEAEAAQFLQAKGMAMGRSETGKL